MIKRCQRVLQLLKKHACAYPFLQPVDPDALGIPDYFQIVKNPIDISIVERNLKNGQYSSSMQFAADVKKIWMNSFLYNQKGTQIYSMTSQMQGYFEQLLGDLDK